MVTCGLSALVILASCVCAQDWYSVDPSTKHYENDVIEVTHGGSHSGYWGKGITTFKRKDETFNYGYTLDCFGCGYAAYDRTGPSTFEMAQATDDMLEMHLRYTDCVNVDKRERLFRGLDILEMEYASISVLWYEDFLNNSSSPTFFLYGVDTDITKTYYNQTSCSGENFGDCWMGNMGVSAAACTYKNHLIFGSHNGGDGKGIGEVYPTAMGIHDWKVWWSDRPTANYECFPAAKSNQKRWIYLYEGGREGGIAKGKQICDCVEAGISMSECFRATGTPPSTRVRGNSARGGSLARVVSSADGFLRVPRAPDGATRMTVYDGAGRIVASRGVSSGSARAVPVDNVGANVYIVRFDAGSR
jgi:hypothetical protein